jgi:AGZA family xanthine/uracil permease-like MFS transporter
MFKILDRIFRLREKGARVPTELLGGLTTFLTMAYIVFVNPDILSASGVDFGAAFVATALVAAIATIAMGLWANLPVALAPGMGLNAFFSFTVVFGMGYTWQQALAAVFVSGVIYFIIAVVGIRKLVVSSIPPVLKKAIGAGIGFFIAFIGLKNAGLVVDNPATLVGLGDLSVPSTLLAVFGLLLTVALLALKLKAAVFFGLVGTAIAGVVAGSLGIEGMPEFSGFFGEVPSIAPTFGVLFSEIESVVTSGSGWIAIGTFLFVDFFDTAGTLVAVVERVPSASERDIDRANHVDSAATVVGSVLGTSTTTSFIESLSGIGTGAKTGLASVFTGLLFLLTLFLSPLLSLVTASVTAPALVIVGSMMALSLNDIDWEDLPSRLAGFVTPVIMVLTFSIPNGIGFGFIVYVLASLFSGKFRNLNLVLVALSLLFVAYYWFL